MPLRILSLSAGSLCAHHLLSMPEPWRGEYAVMGTNSIAEAPGPFLCDAAVLLAGSLEAAQILENKGLTASPYPGRDPTAELAFQ